MEHKVLKAEDIPMWKKFEAYDLNHNNEVVRCCRDSEDAIFVFAKGKKRKGWRYEFDTFNRLFAIIVKDENAEWHKKLATIEKRLEKSGLWSNIKEVAHDLQNIPLNEYLMVRLKADPEILEKYPFLVNKEITDKTVVNWKYLEDWCLHPTIKSMYFGYFNKETKEQIKEALVKKETFSRRVNANTDLTSYDVSFDYTPAKNTAFYSEEYRGCGNGHYYLALDNSSALFYEND